MPLKIGDINGSVANNNSSDLENRTTPLLLQMETEALPQASRYRITFSAEQLETLEGLQFTLQFDSNKFTLEALNEGIIQTENVGYSQLEEGRILISWNIAEADAKKQGKLFELILLANEVSAKAPTVQLIEQPLVAEAYLQGNLVKPIALQPIITPENTFQVYQNEPNPFFHQTSVAFNLPEDGWVELTVFDTKGREVTSLQHFYQAGYHTLELSPKNLQAATGVLYYTLKSSNYSETRKMIRLE
ncbi:MAG: T9SS type A sorting domain-containing protein [Saprospiraceae bacterium]|nr:T9SS type A sorting domain-containing protein [Saprospiraceae bacterium]